MKNLYKSLLIGLLLISHNLFAQEKEENNELKCFNFHYQLTTITQGHQGFSAQYSGTNSLLNTSESKTSVTATMYFGMRLWKGAELYLNPELSGGGGLSGAVGIAGFPNGEIYRVGNPTPVITPARFYLKQTFNFKGKRENIEDAANQLNGNQSNNRLTLVAGKFSLTDFFDNNTYSHDARMQFMNWSLMDDGAWDYAADTRGYTYGIYSEYYRNLWAARFAAVLVPKSANGLELDTRIKDAYSINFELEKSFKLFKRNSVLRLVFYRNAGQMGNYRLATDDTTYHMDITQTRIYSRSKNGFGLNFEHELYKDAGIFIRTGWNDGKNETWAFTEIDRTISAGLLLTGSMWKREDDRTGIAFVVNGLSKDHKDYLSKGGYGFIIGDGKLNYASEMILEVFYEIRLFKVLYLTADYQLVINPAYNKDRGPVNIWSIRSHVEM
jgi:high affinity Mn2+ porin